MTPFSKLTEHRPTVRAVSVVGFGLLLIVAILFFIHARMVSRSNEPARIAASPTGMLAECIVSASTLYQVPTEVILGIITVEGGRPGLAAGPNINGSYDLGLMQVNSLWVPQLALLWQVDYPTAYAALRDSGCENIYVGTWILKHKIAETGTLYDGIAAYHSATRAFGVPYADRVVAAMGQKTVVVSR